MLMILGVDGKEKTWRNAGFGYSSEPAIQPTRSHKELVATRRIYVLSGL
jgi:hypothetical protein